MSLDEIVYQVVQDFNAILIDYRLTGDKRNRRLKVIVDTEPGITIGELTDISRALQKSDSLSELFPAGFQLEVTSPGLSYPLTKYYQFKRNINRRLRLNHTKSDLPNPLKGFLKSVDNKKLEIEVGKNRYQIEWDQIEEGKLILK